MEMEVGGGRRRRRAVGVRGSVLRGMGVLGLRDMWVCRDDKMEEMEAVRWRRWSVEQTLNLSQKDFRNKKNATNTELKEVLLATCCVRLVNFTRILCGRVLGQSEEDFSFGMISLCSPGLHY